MVFESLPPELQNIYMVNIEFFLKVSLVIFLAFICYNTINKAKDNKETGYLFVGYIRALLYYGSKLTLFLLPFVSAFILYPAFTWDIILRYIIMFYMVSIVVGTIVLIANFLFVPSAFILKKVGFNIDGDRTDKILAEIEESGLKIKQVFRR